MAKKKTETQETPEQGEQQEQPGIVESVIETASSALDAVVETVADGIEVVANAVGLDGNDDNEQKTGRRAQKVGTVSSDKMTKTVVVNVDRKVMHPKYRRYVRRTSKFMAHDEMETGIGDKVRIEETRPMSARKRWRVIEILQKAAK
ncbi:MAG: 30S ribosomal protein S17 [Pyrinomonadaceae bacterium]